MVVHFAGSADVLVRNEREARTIYKSSGKNSARYADEDVRNEREARTIYKSSGKNSARYADEDVRAPSHHGLHFINYTTADRYHYPTMKSVPAA